MNILFVCLGNICRSPLAEGIARHYVSKLGLEANIDSAGTSGWHDGEPPCEGSINVAKKYGIDISSLRSRKISPYQDDSFDVIVAMDKGNVADLLAMGFVRSKIVKLGAFGLKNADVPDPYHYTDGKGFEAVYAMINTGVKNLLAHYFKISIE
ncbi:low molecular weight protein-tyrosine-phosphatase [Helicobacter sp. 11S02596-1]|uniref:low molecular weight protein-tyrosine-phosphatase n=1 Tax=Helicobacter sp. 11S02596-1 TaxID=1476194 RepID=UPI000BA6A569|nr:low molecular weight protein-tyrosine-phosphatase [Helicobacter sp. 11S02596-1]PAF42484.1 protein tyrosine phosphatase [Helicobacter sp. 11S02596-1]